jgi:PTH2 family peptidyl-tRNA hydrolase
MNELMTKVNDMKQVIIVRKDLSMRKGKMIAQGAHASLMAYLMTRPKYQTEWLESYGQAKICVGVDSIEELMDIYQKANYAMLKAAIVLDEGRTEFREPTYTAICIGPDFKEKIDPITGHLKLL